MGLLAFPAMLRAGYNTQMAAGAVTAGGCLGILIPPSVLLIVYGATAGVSVVQLYAGAFFPGIMLAGLYLGYVIVMAKIKPSLAPPLAAADRVVPLPETAKAVSPDGRRLFAFLQSPLGPPPVVGGVGVAILHGYDLAQFHIKPLNTLAVGLGAAIFGVGMVLYGYCPGTGLAALATGRVDALAGMVGMLLGGVAYAFSFDWVAVHILPVGAFGKLRIPELLSLPEWVCYLGLLAMSVGTFYLIGRHEPETPAHRDVRA